MSYHVGVAQGLLDAGMITPEVPLAGASGGALAAFCAALQPSPPGGVTTDVLLRAVLEANGKCRAKGAFRNLREFLDEALDDLLPRRSTANSTRMATSSRVKQCKF